MSLSQPIKESMKLFCLWFYVYPSELVACVDRQVSERAYELALAPVCERQKRQYPWPLIYFIISYHILGLLMKPRRENRSELSWRLVSWVPFPSLSATTDIYGHHCFVVVILIPSFYLKSFMFKYILENWLTYLLFWVLVRNVDIHAPYKNLHLKKILGNQRHTKTAKICPLHTPSSDIWLSRHMYLGPAHSIISPHSLLCQPLCLFETTFKSYFPLLIACSVK